MTPPCLVAPDSVAPVLLQVTDLACAVAGRPLWRNVNLTLHAGESVAIRGPSGTGKTLFLRTLAGLRPADAGRIAFVGKALHDWAMPDYRARVSYLAQRPALPEGSVRAALAAPFALGVHRSRHFQPEQARRLLAEFDMAPAFLDQATTDLSGGQAQIAALLRALLVEPAILLLDEPTASLDAERTQRVERLLDRWLHGAATRACAWVSHDSAQTARVSARALELGAA